MTFCHQILSSFSKIYFLQTLSLADVKVFFFICSLTANYVQDSIDWIFDILILDYVTLVLWLCIIW